MSTLSLTCAEFQGNITAGLLSMFESEQYTNVTIAVEGKYLKAHQMVLSICSPYFNSLLQSAPCKHPIIFIKNVKYNIMQHLLRFMYEGQTEIAAEDYQLFIETAQELQIKWLMKCNEQNITTTKTKRENATQPAQEPMKHETSFNEHVAKRPKILIDGRNADYAAATASGSNDTAHGIKMEKANYSYPQQIVETIQTIGSANSATLDAGRYFAEPIDKTRDLEEMVMNYLDDRGQEPVKQEKLGHRDVKHIHYPNDELLQPMEPVPNTSMQSSSALEGEPVTVSFYTGRSGVNVMISNYSYHKHRVAKSWITWGCARRCSRACTATLKLTHDKRIVFKNEHNHMPEGKLYPDQILNEAIYYRGYKDKKLVDL